MSGGGSGALVCGFADLAAGLGGVAWSLGETGGLLMTGDAVVEAQSEISDQDGSLQLRLTSEEEQVEATLAPRTGALPLRSADGSPPPGGALEAASCVATLKSAEQGRTVQSPGHLTRWASDPLKGAGTVRHLACEGGEDTLLVLASWGASGASGHGEEHTAGWVLDGEGGSSSFAESLISTQYDAEGRPTRAGLELWPHGEEEAMIRSAATRAAATRLGGVEKDHVSAALLRCTIDGSQGLGSYLLWRK